MIPIGAFLCVLGCYGCSSPKTEVKSPDGHIKMALTVDDNGKPLYNILVGDSLLIENSTLGFTEKNGIDLGGGFHFCFRTATPVTSQHTQKSSNDIIYFHSISIVCI